MKKFIYSIKEIEDKAKLTYSDRQLKKDWLAKHIEIISSKTVLKDLKLGGNYWLEAENTEDKYEKFRLFQQSLAHYFLAYFRSNGKDKKSEKELNRAKEEYHSHLFNYFLKISDDFDYYEKDCEFIKELASILEKEEKLTSIEEALNTFYYNIEAFSLYKKILDLKENRLEHCRFKLKEYQDSRTKVAFEISKKLQKVFVEKLQELDKIVNNSTLLLKADRKKLQNLLKFIKYFNTKSYIKYKNIISKFYSLRALRYFIENEFSYEDYEGLNRNYKLYEKTMEIKETNKITEEAKDILTRVLNDYNEGYMNHNLNMIFSHHKDFESSKLFIIEKFIKKLESSDFDLIKELDSFKALEKAIDENIKIEEILMLLDRSRLSSEEIIRNKFKERYSENLEKIEGLSKFKLSIIDKKMDKNYIILCKENIKIGRKNKNDIVIDNKYISREHLTFDLSQDKIINGGSEKKNISYWNNKKEIIYTLDIYHDKIREINIGNLFTYFLEESYNKNIVLNPVKEKSNVAYLSDQELKNFIQKKYILMPEKNDFVLDTESSKIIPEENQKSLSLHFSNVIQVKKKGRSFRTIKPGLNYFDNRFEYILERL